MPRNWSEAATISCGIAPMDLSACRTLLSNGSRTFHAASKFLPREVREPATALYAFCRVADDAIDAEGGSPQAVTHLQDRLDRIYRGCPLPVPADRAFAAVIHHFGIPRDIPEALIEGFAWDAEGRTYASLEDLSAYAARVAGTVGAMMSLIMQARAPEVVARACDLGVAMQYTNIARDVGEDARMGRLYLPRNWLEEAGVDADAWLQNPVFTPAIGSVIARLLDAAEQLYRRAETGIGALPPACRPGMQAARWIYAAIGDEVARQHYDSISTRAYVGAPRKIALLLVACTAALASGPPLRAPALKSTQFLVSAVAEALPPTASVVAGREQAGIEDRVVWLLDLFERLERRGREQPA
jgi:15-cis-phytoene synthase